MKKLLLLTAFVLCVLAWSAAAENEMWNAYLTEEGNILIADYTYEGTRVSELTLGKGEERYVSVLGSDYVKFYATGSYVADIQDDGTLEARDVGESKLRVYVTPTHYVEIKVSVKKAPSSVNFDQSKLTVRLGSSGTLAVTLSKNSAGSVTFLSSDDSVAWIGEDGTVHPVGEGVCTVTATTYNDLTCECEVTVELPAPAQVATKAVTGYACEEVQIPCVLTGGYNETVTYVSSDESILTVSEDGTARCLKEGRCDVTVTASRGSSAVCSVEVLPCASMITPAEYTVYLYEGGTYTPRAETLGGSGAFTVLCESGIASADGTSVTALSEGTCTVTLTAPGGASADITLRVIPSPADFTVSCPSVIAMGEQVQIELGGAGPKMSASFISSDPAVLTVSGDGLLTAVVPGETTVTVTCGYISREIPVKVDFPAKGISFNSKELTLGLGDTAPLSVTLSGGSGQVTYASSDERVVCADGDIVTASGIGQATVTARLASGISASLPVTVSPAPESIFFPMNTVTIGRGDSVNLSVSYPVGQFALLTWSSSDEAVASVDGNGCVKAHGTDGRTTITARTRNGVSASVTLIVSGSPSEISIDADPVAQESLFTHYVSLKEGSEHSLGISFPSYDSVTYTCVSHDGEIAQVSAEGVIKALRAGTARVSIHVYNGFTVEVLVEVK